jgi:hypothetical protein
MARLTQPPGVGRLEREVRAQAQGLDVGDLLRPLPAPRLTPRVSGQDLAAKRFQGPLP